MTSHRFHGDPERFHAVADFVAVRFPDATTAADVAGGQGMLARVLRKRHNVDCEVVDPRGWTLKGVRSRPEEYRAEMAGYYDVIIGLHPDEALRDVVESARTRPVVVIPCCNFWSRETKLGQPALLGALAMSHEPVGAVEEVSFDFRGPHNLGLVLLPPVGRGPIGGPDEVGGLRCSPRPLPRRRERTPWRHGHAH